MSDLLRRIEENIGKGIFCYGKSGGEGYVLRTKCECHCQAKLDCQAVIDKDNFHSYFKGIPYEKLPFYRTRIIAEIKDEFKDSQWWKDNVVE